MFSIGHSLAMALDDLDPRLLEAWMLAVLVLSLKMIGVAQLTGIVRLLQGSFAALEGERRAPTHSVHIATECRRASGEYC